MNDRHGARVVIVLDRKTLRLLAALALVAALSATLFSEQLTLTTTYPSPVGVYNQIITMGNSAGTPMNTILNRRAGNTIMAPVSNPLGRVGIGTESPSAKLDVAGEVRVGATGLACAAATGGVLRFTAGRMEYCDGAAWRSIMSASCQIVAGASAGPACCPAGTTMTGGGVGNDSWDTAVRAKWSYPSSANCWTSDTANAGGTISYAICCR